MFLTKPTELCILWRPQVCHFVVVKWDAIVVAFKWPTVATSLSPIIGCIGADPEEAEIIEEHVAPFRSNN
jgi:hypothetical protein